jgi:hypothetical protein
MEHDTNSRLLEMVSQLKNVASNVGTAAVSDHDERPKYLQVALTGMAILRKTLTLNWCELAKERKEATEKLEAINQLWVTGGLSCYGTGLVNFVSVLIELAKKWREIEGVYHGMLGMCRRGGMKKDSDPRYFILDMIDKAAKWDELQKSTAKPKSKGSRCGTSK